MKTADEFWARFDFKSWESSKASARVDFKDIDPEKGTAAAYLAKYISKNIDGMKSDGEGMGEDEEAAPGTPASETAKRVGAWAAQWGIRQFQQIGGVPVTLYRELRRVHVDADDSLLYRAVHAADEGDWGKFVALLGGEDFAFVKRADLPLKLYKEETEERNKYGEAKPAILRGVVELETGEYLISRDKEWQLRQRDGGPAAAWTCVNNCTKTRNGQSVEMLKAYNPPTPEEIERTLASCEEIEEFISASALNDESWDFDWYGFDGEEQGRHLLKKSEQERIIGEAAAAAAAERQKSIDLAEYREYLRRLDSLRIDEPIMKPAPLPKPARPKRYQPRPASWTADDILAKGQQILNEINKELNELDLY